MHTIETALTNTDTGKKKVIKIEIPSEWADLNRKQLFSILPYAMKKELDDYHRTKLLSKLIPSKIFKSWEDEHVNAALELVDWVTNTDMTIPIVSSFSHGNMFLTEKYHLPHEFLENITCQEWHFADEYYNDFIENRNEKELNSLIATICRPKSHNKCDIIARDDIRTPLIGRMGVEERAKNLKKLNPRIKLYVLFFFSCNKNWVYETYKPYLFSDQEEDDGSTEQDNSSLPFGWYSLYQKVAESGVFGTLNNILMNVKFHDFCTYLITKKAQFDQIKKEQDAARRKSNADLLN